MNREWDRWALRICKGFEVSDDAVRSTRRIAIFDTRARDDATSTDVCRANAPLLPVDRSQIPLGGSLPEGHRSLYGGGSRLFRTGQ